MKPVLFYEDEYYWLSNFSAHQVEFDGRLYPTAEHAYQAQKFIDDRIKEKVRSAKSPVLAKAIAYRYKKNWRPNWHTMKVEIMKKIAAAKLAQHEDIRQALIKTGQAEIKENSPVDYFWGIGRDGRGQNLMGKIWMQLREKVLE
jgi:hypothetical protein